MQLQLNAGQGVELSEALEAHIKQQLQSVERRFGERLTRIEVYLTDVNGPKGGANKLCKLEARPRGQGPVVAESLHEDAYAAVSGASRRLESVLSTHYGKLDNRSAARNAVPEPESEEEPEDDR
ncbi:MAG: HPF/RaiA family ribosome-associated protein [Ectothiorhodospiraceae bacterium]|nr:HPF/RaiA family ribosome-associated protein [Ectothiorhodospiraceae bacterium]MCH8504733.1 HPF/RaiA family ribosome-associated protein [Ectothiorhodospiraceae bacterium]